MTTVAALSCPAYDELSIRPWTSGPSPRRSGTRLFKVLREQRPVSWHRPLEGSPMPPENDGVWVVTSHELVREVSRKKAKIFCSSRGFQFEEVPRTSCRRQVPSSAWTIPSGHAKLRRLVSTAFTPKQVASIHEQIRNQARIIVDDLLAHPEGDLFRRYPKAPDVDHLRDGRAGGSGGPRTGGTSCRRNGPGPMRNVAAGRESGEVLNDALVGLLEIGFDLADQRRTSPRNDLMTNLVQAEVDGEQLTDEEIASFFVLLSVAGNDTTRN